jgi:single-stranded-DNA-specific exonuclease
VTSAHFLGIGRSASGRRWQLRLTESRLAEAIAQQHELPEILARVLVARGVAVDEAEAFLNPTIRTLMPQPGALRDMEKGAARLASAIIEGERIGVITDYDVDGVSSAALGSRKATAQALWPCRSCMPKALGCSSRLIAACSRMIRWRKRRASASRR